uniref:Reticulon n=1 Tax=Sphaeramia orbicularis TaxID=375764 RepID=A0A672Z781_9TELE
MFLTYSVVFTESLHVCTSLHVLCKFPVSVFSICSSCVPCIFCVCSYVLCMFSTCLAALQLIHWKEPKKSALAFGLSLLVLISMATLSVISVVSYLLLTCLCITITFRVYKSVIQAVQKSNEGHPFKSLLDRDISLSADAVRQIADQVIVHLNQFSFQTRRLLLVEDLVDSLKLAAVMWVMTHVGAVFNGLTILILADIIFFTSPLIYQKKKVSMMWANNFEVPSTINKTCVYKQSWEVTQASSEFCRNVHCGIGGYA